MSIELEQHFHGNSPATIMMMMLSLLLLLSGSAVLSSPLDPEDMELLEMMLRDGDGYPNAGRMLRDISVLPASSIGCDENGSEEDFTIYGDVEESAECEDFLPPCEPAVVQDYSIDHPCFLRLILLRTPLLKHDPCANFTLAPEIPKSSEKRKPKKKCDPKSKASKSRTQNEVKAMPNTGPKEVKAMPKTENNETKLLANPGENATTNTDSNSTVSATATTEATVGSSTERKRVPNRRNRKQTTPRTTTTTTTSTTGATTTEEAITTEDTTTEISSTSTVGEEEQSTTTEQETTTTTAATTTTTAPTRRATRRATRRTTRKKGATPRTTRAIPLNENPNLKSGYALEFKKRHHTVTPQETNSQMPTNKNGSNSKTIQIKFKANGNARVPDTPKIKIDSQPSEVIHVVLNKTVGEMRQLPAEDNSTPITTTTTTTTSEPETTTEESCEEDMETTNEAESEAEAENDTDAEEYFPETEEETEEDLFVSASDMDGAQSTSTTEEPCVDTDDQDTNLCPQFMPAYGSSNSRPPAGPRFRKPVKNYVEPILYEGSFAKPRQRIGLTQPQPQRRDYFVTNKQIVPRPRPKYRQRLPHSIYMNNIIRGVDCVDDVTASPPYPQVGPYPPVNLYQAVGPAQPAQGQRNWPARRLTGGYGSVQRSTGYGPAPAPVQRIRSSATPRYPGCSEEEQQQQQHQHQHINDRESNEDQHYFEEEAAALMRAPNPTPSVDPCQAEHDHPLYGQHLQQTDPDGYPQSKNFFT
ncbi:mucin-5AC [Drosophila obscura]|uniref:mucin-5AC n=1 Tax=Drosophila obscura TaxID=7282 RepID=UPI001BB19A51|nr:mucin-5AC [Drosophila obscura]